MSGIVADKLIGRVVGSPNPCRADHTIWSRVTDQFETLGGLDFVRAYNIHTGERVAFAERVIHTIMPKAY